MRGAGSAAPSPEIACAITKCDSSSWPTAPSPRDSLRSTSTVVDAGSPGPPCSAGTEMPSSPASATWRSWGSSDDAGALAFGAADGDVGGDGVSGGQRVLR